MHSCSEGKVLSGHKVQEYGLDLCKGSAEHGCVISGRMDANQLRAVRRRTAGNCEPDVSRFENTPACQTSQKPILGRHHLVPHSHAALRAAYAWSYPRSTLRLRRRHRRTH